MILTGPTNARNGLALARELFERYVHEPRKSAEKASTKTKRGIQLVLESRLRKVGLGAAYERNYVADVGKLAEWTFDYAGQGRAGDVVGAAPVEGEESGHLALVRT